MAPGFRILALSVLGAVLSAGTQVGRSEGASRVHSSWKATLKLNFVGPMSHVALGSGETLLQGTQLVPRTRFDGRRLNLLSASSSLRRRSGLLASVSDLPLVGGQHGNSETKKVLIIGGGVGGIALAARLAKSRPSWDITVLEKNAKLGGRLDDLHKDGFRFDTGPTLLLAPDIYRSTFDAIGYNMSSFVELLRVEPAYKVFLSDDTPFTLTSDLGAMMRQLESIEEGSFPSFLSYMREACVNYVRGFASRPFKSMDNSIWDYVNLDNINLLRDFDPTNLLENHWSRLGRYFKDDRLRELFSFQDLYVGVSPHEAPAIFSLLQYLELVEGVWYPSGGFQNVLRGLQTAAAELGVTIRTGARVESVIADSDKPSARATGVVLQDGEFISGDVIISNVDLPTAYATLLPYPAAAARAAAAAEMEGKRYSSGTIAFYWSLRRAVPGLAHHTVFLSPDGRAAWDQILAGGGGLPARPSFYACCPAKTDPSAAPAGSESLMVLVPVGCESRHAHGDYREATARAREAVLTRMRQCGIDISDSIVAETVYTPTEFRERYGVFRGASFGLSHTLDQLVALRPANRHPARPNVYFVGASTAPGNGVPLVLTGAHMLARRILADHPAPPAAAAAAGT